MAGRTVLAGDWFDRVAGIHDLEAVMMQQLDMFVPAARGSDPLTSHMAGAEVQVRAGSQRARILAVYAEHPLLGLIDEEAGRFSGLNTPGCCYWKRCSELRQLGLIRVSSEMRESSVGKLQQVCHITEEGRKALEELQKGE